MRKLIDVNPFKRESREKFNLLHPSGKEFRIKEFFENHKKTALKWLVVLLVIFSLWKLLPANLFKWQIFSGIDSNKLQAVFLTNNQTYFGHISKIDKNYLVLKGVYYLKATQLGQSGQQLNLVKLSDEIYGPEDEIHISGNQVSFWQNLREDSQIVKMISQLESK